MARPLSTSVTVSHRPNRPLPWLARWYETDPRGDRGQKSRSFATETEVQAFKAKLEAAVALEPLEPSSPSPSSPSRSSPSASRPSAPPGPRRPPNPDP